VFSASRAYLKPPRDESAAAVFRFSMNAVTLLKKDHRSVERLFEGYRAATKGKRVIVEEITRQLSAHMAAEERELYPVLRRAIDNGPALMSDAEKEHSEARGLLMELSSLEEGSFEMDAKVATLRGAIAHHVKDEEEEIFPKAERTLGDDALSDLGMRIARAKRSAPKRPSRSAAKHSPGTSATGVASAAFDRMKRVFAGPAPKRVRKSSSRRKKTRTVSTPRAKSAASRKRATKRR
jgi:hemerythrin superfamily protein